MATCLFRSPLAFRLQAFLETRCATGREQTSSQKLLHYLDRFLMAELAPGEPLTGEIAERWFKSIEHLSAGTRINRTSILRQDVDLKRRILHVREGKFKKSRYVPFSASTAAGLAAYLDKRPGRPSQPTPRFRTEKYGVPYFWPKAKRSKAPPERGRRPFKPQTALLRRRTSVGSECIWPRPDTIKGVILSEPGFD